MATYRSQELFASGPTRFKVHGVILRHQAVEQPGVDGAKIVGLGRNARAIDQYGTLHADSVGALQAALAAVEALVDGKGGDLVDDLGRVWARMVVVEFQTRAVKRIGVRLGVDYFVRYVQTQPAIGGVL